MNENIHKNILIFSLLPYIFKLGGTGWFPKTPQFSYAE